MTLVRRFVIYMLASIGVLTGSAVFDLGSRAEAAYQSMSSHTASSGCGADRISVDDDGRDSAKTDKRDSNNHISHWAMHRPGGDSGGAGSPTGPNSTSVSASAGMVSAAELPAQNLVRRLHFLDASLELSEFVESILDPPRSL